MNKPNNTFIITSWSRVPLEKLIVAQLGQEIPNLLWNPEQGWCMAICHAK
jgi:hypothetical protein